MGPSHTTALPVIAEGYAYNSVTKDWTERVEYVARDEMEALRWIKFNRDWMKGLRIVRGNIETKQLGN